MIALPGLALAAIVAAIAALLGAASGTPAIPIGLALGMALGPLVRDARWDAGLTLAGRDGLRIGIAILGVQVTLGQIVALGAGPFAGVLAVMAVTIGAALLVARASGQSRATGVLAGGATAICGASAALALYGVIGKERVSQAQFTLTLVGISVASATALTLYPFIARALALTDAQAGFLTGAAIHDVAQAIGGGFAVSDRAGAAATVVKLARVALLAPLVTLVSLAVPHRDGAARPWWRRLAPPWFIGAFLGLVLVNSVAPLPPGVVAAGLWIAKALLLLAVVATALRTRLDLVRQLGWAATLPVIAATIASFATALVIAIAFI